MPEVPSFRQLYSHVHVSMGDHEATDESVQGDEESAPEPAARAPAPRPATAVPRPVPSTPMDMPTTAETVADLKRRLGKELYRMELDLAGGGRIAGKPCDCQPGDALVYTISEHGGTLLPCAQAYKRRSSHMLSHTGEVREVTDHMSRRFSGLMHEFKWAYSNIPLRVTPEHPLYVIKDGWRPNWRCAYGGLKEADLAWVRAADVGGKDFIGFPRFLTTSDMDIITPDLAELLGWYVAEGSHSRNDAHRIVLSLGHHEREEIARVSDFMKHSFGEYPKRYDRATAVDLTYNHGEFTTIFSSFGHNAQTKHLPYWFLRLPEAKQARFLKGLFDGDGHLSKYGISFCTASAQLAFQLRLMLFRLGILHALAERHMQEGNIGGRIIHSNGPYYFITISGEAMQRLTEIAGFDWAPASSRNPGNHGWVSEGYVFLPMRASATTPFDGLVYNFSIDQDESYLTPNGAVHNCLSKKHELGLEATAEELIPLDADPVYNQLLGWLKTHSPTFEPAEIAKHPPEYYQELAREVRAIRKRVMGTDNLGALLNQDDKAKVLDKIRGMMEAAK